MTTFSKHDLKVGNHLYFERGELLDDAFFAETNNIPFSLEKSKRLAEVSEQIRLIENVTAENQALYFDPRTPEQRAADEDAKDYENTIADVRTGFQQW
jgi:hypothetical protein